LRWEELDEDIWVDDAVCGRFPCPRQLATAWFLLHAGGPTKLQAAAVLHEAAANLAKAETICELEEEMLIAENNLEFKKAVLLRDQIRELKRALDGSKSMEEVKAKPVSYRKTHSQR
jgi:hypothetical protein